MKPPNPTCWQNHMGVWAIEQAWFSAAVAAIRAGTWKPRAEMARFPRTFLHASRPSIEGTPVTDAKGDQWKTFQPGGPIAIQISLARPKAPAAFSDDDLFDDAEDPVKTPYLLVDGGVAVIELLGPMMKARSKYGGASTLGIRDALNTAAADPAVSSILLHVESPGGTAAGTPELADTITAVDKRKPVHAYIEDMGASAALWAASAARRVTANATAQIGSIGAFLVLDDTSKAAELAGVKVHVLSTGPDKGVGVDGTAIAAEQLKPFQEWVDYLGKLFATAIQKNRGLTEKRLAAVTSGRCWAAPDALELKLIDAVEPWAAALKATAAAGAAAAKANRSTPGGARSAALAGKIATLRLWASTGPKPPTS